MTMIHPLMGKNGKQVPATATVTRAQAEAARRRCEAEPDGPLLVEMLGLGEK